MCASVGGRGKRLPAINPWCSCAEHTEAEEPSKVTLPHTYRLTLQLVAGHKPVANSRRMLSQSASHSEVKAITGAFGQQMLVISEMRKQKQEDSKFKASGNHLVRCCLRTEANHACGCRTISSNMPKPRSKPKEKQKSQGHLKTHGIRLCVYVVCFF